MSQRRPAIAAAGVLAGGLLIAGLRAYRQRPRDRTRGHEGLEDPAITRAYLIVSRLPPMRLLRRYIARKATRAVSQGQALDLGCGPGQLSVTLAQAAPGLRVTGLDLSEAMIALANRQSGEAGLAGQVTLAIGDAGAIPFPDGSVDLVVSTLSVHHWTDPIRVLDEIARVLRPAGGLLIFDLRRDLSPPAWLLLWVVTRFVAPRALRRAGEPLASRNAAYTPSEVAGMARRSRLQDWQVTPAPLGWILERRGAR